MTFPLHIDILHTSSTNLSMILPIFVFFSLIVRLLTNHLLHEYLRINLLRIVSFLETISSSITVGPPRRGLPPP